MTANRLQRGVRATFIGLAVNTLLAGTKLAAGILGHSHALIADAVESLADVFSSLVVWRALVVADAPADEDHPYGHGKAEPIAAAIVAAVLLVAAGSIGLQATREISEPHTAPAPFTLLVLGVAVLIKEGLFRFVRGESVSVDSTAMKADAWHHRSDAITSLAAGLGIGVALVGGKGFEAADSVAAIIAAGIIAWNGWGLARGALVELMDTAPRQELLDQIRRLAEDMPGVHRVEKCLARKMGYHFYVDLHVEVDPQMTVQRSHEIAHEVKDKIREQIPVVRDVLVHIEPAGNAKSGAGRSTADESSEKRE
jgi:cation diffusion facilitator family transporter